MNRQPSSDLSEAEGVYGAFSVNQGAMAISSTSYNSTNSFTNFPLSETNVSESLFLTESTNSFIIMESSPESPPVVGSIRWHQEQRRVYAQRLLTSESTLNSSRNSDNSSCSSYEVRDEEACTSSNMPQKKSATKSMNASEEMFPCTSIPSTSREHNSSQNKNSQNSSILYPASSSNSSFQINSETNGNQHHQRTYYTLPSPNNGVNNTANNHSLLDTSNNSSIRSNILGTYINGNNNSFYCFGLFMVRSTFYIFFLFDILLLAHLLVFTLTNYSNGQQTYDAIKYSNNISTKNFELKDAAVKGLAIVTSLIPYHFLLPLLVVQILWVASAISSILAIKCVQPLLQIPYILISALITLSMLCLIAKSITQFLIVTNSVEWVSTLVLSFINIILIAQLYFFYIKIILIHVLFRKRKTVVSTVISPEVVVVVANNNNNNSANFSTSSVASPNSRNKPSMKKKIKNINLTTIYNDKQQHGIDMHSKSNGDCCSCSECCCCDETYSTKSTIIITEEDEIIRHKKY